MIAPKIIAPSLKEVEVDTLVMPDNGVCCLSFPAGISQKNTVLGMSMFKNLSFTDILPLTQKASKLTENLFASFAEMFDSTIIY